MTFDPCGLCAICKERGTDTIILPALAELIANAKKDRSN